MLAQGVIRREMVRAALAGDIAAAPAGRRAAIRSAWIWHEIELGCRTLLGRGEDPVLVERGPGVVLLVHWPDRAGFLI